jgi:hypothetical protein
MHSISTSSSPISELSEDSLGNDLVGNSNSSFEKSNSQSKSDRLKSQILEGYEPNASDNVLGFEGTNYSLFTTQMASYLQSRGLGKYITERTQALKDRAKAMIPGH